jgi:signal transduction histidine kinase
VVYPRSDSEQLIDAHGREAALSTGGRAVARIIRGDRTRALVVHDPALVDEPELERALGSTARLAVENEALRAEALAQLEELKASRARIVEAGDAARRGLERNLHDGAQQRLLALSYDLRLANAAARAEHDEALVAVLDAAGDDTASALDELRELAQGIHPAILAEAGLAPALQTLADEAPLPVELGNVVPERQTAAIETTAYVTVSEAIEDANRRRATFLGVRFDRENGRLVITAVDDGAPRSTRLVSLADRVGALGGSLDVAATTLRAELPCE